MSYKMREIRRLTICGLRYRVFLATSDEVPELETEDGFTSFRANRIYLRNSLEPTRLRDTLLHEVIHAYLEASGLGELLKIHTRGNYDKLEEAIIRLAVPSLLRLVDENGGALMSVPRQRKSA